VRAAQSAARTWIGAASAAIVSGSKSAARSYPPAHREGDAEAHQRDVDGERQRLHPPRLEHVMLRDRIPRQRTVE
jgi:hypothetical protein